MFLCKITQEIKNQQNIKNCSNVIAQSTKFCTLPIIDKCEGSLTQKEDCDEWQTYLLNDLIVILVLVKEISSASAKNGTSLCSCYGNGKKILIPLLGIEYHQPFPRCLECPKLDSYHQSLSHLCLFTVSVHTSKPECLKVCKIPLSSQDYHNMYIYYVLNNLCS